MDRMREPRQIGFDGRRYDSGRGGPRIGAGRPPLSKNPPVHHVKRPPVPRACPAHVTLHVRRGVPALRQKRFLRELRPSLRKACERGEFRVAHYSVQGNHLHLIVEAAGKEALGRGMRAIAPRVARAVQRAFGWTGAVLYGRYQLRQPPTPYPPLVSEAHEHAAPTTDGWARTRGDRATATHRPAPLSSLLPLAGGPAHDSGGASGAT